MKVAGLISGGKDSIYNLLQCVAAGHNIVALANIYPKPSTCKDELDSYMYQTVGHEGINLIADAMQLPLFRQETVAHCRYDGLNYVETDGDEVEDLYSLLSRVSTELKVEAVSVGAIASDYQRTRVEHVCGRLGLTCLAYLWHQNQAQLLRAMISSHVDAIVVKVASMGLIPSKHLGMTISALEPEVSKLHEKFGANICGEGGEYETFVVDCPLYHSKIVLDNLEVIHDGMDSGYLRLSGHLEGKPDVCTEEMLYSTVRNMVPPPHSYITDCFTMGLVDVEIDSEGDLGKLSEAIKVVGVDAVSENVPSVSKSSGWLFGSNINAANICDALNVAKDLLKLENMCLSNVVSVGLWVRDMAEFVNINRDYGSLMCNSAPTRACVATPLSQQYPITLDFVASKPSNNPEQTSRKLHIQSISHWAPANIGPYSQCIQEGSLAWVSGQIPLIPGSMSLLNGTLEQQVRLCVRHISRLLEDVGFSLSKVLQVFVYVADEEIVRKVVSLVAHAIPNNNAIMIGAVVSTLPKSAPLEVVVMAVDNKTDISGNVEKQVEDGIEIRTETSSSGPVTSLASHISCSKPGPIDCKNLQRIIVKCVSPLLQCQGEERAVQIRFLFTAEVEGLEAAIISILPSLTQSNCSCTAIPVTSCERSLEFLTVVAICI